MINKANLDRKIHPSIQFLIVSVNFVYKVKDTSLAKSQARRHE